MPSATAFSKTHECALSLIHISSAWFDHDSPQAIELTMAGKCQIVVETLDRAGNEGTSISGYYQLNEGDAAAGQLLAPAAHPGETEYASLRAVCEGCNPQKQQTVTCLLYTSRCV